MLEPSEDTAVVLHVAETMAGGIASYLDEMLPAQRSVYGDAQVQALVPRSHLPHATCLSPDTALTYKDVEFRPLRLLTLAWAFLWALWRVRPDVVHAHSTLAGFVVRVCCALLPKRPVIVYCAHGWAWDREGSESQRAWVIRAERWLAHVTDVIICISEHDHRSALALGISKNKLLTISNGIASSVDLADAQTYVGTPSYRDFLFVGRFDRQKGVDIYLAAMRNMFGKATGYAVGDSVLGSHRDVNWPENVEATGWLARDCVALYMQSVGALVMPSRWEGFGLVALEAMRAGRPVIAARVGGLQDLVVDGVTGFLFDPNSPQALEDALQRAMASDLVAMGQAARERFLDLYTSDRMNRDVIALYDTVSSSAFSKAAVHDGA